MPEQFIGQRMAVRDSIGSQASNPIREVNTASTTNFQFEIRSNKLDQAFEHVSKNIRMQC